MSLLKDKVVIVTGAGGGLGRTYALAFAQEGAKVVVNDVGGGRDGTGASSSMADKVVAEIKAMGGEAVANHDSVSEPDAAERIIQTALKNFGRLDVLVNNAGILRDKTLIKMDDDMWRLVQKVHLDGTFYCGRAAARFFVDSKTPGRIINTSSLSGLRGNYGQSNYAAAKAGIAGLTRVWALELSKYGITVNAIAPMAKTRMTEDIDAVGDDVKPEHISPMVVFLGSDLSKEVNGQIFGCHGRHFFEYKTVITDGVKKDTDWTVQEIAKQMGAIGAEAPKASAAPAASESIAATGADDNSVAGRIRKAFDLMKIAFTADKASGWTANMQYTIEGADNYTVDIKDQKVVVQSGYQGTPTCKISVSAETMAGMIEGKISGQQAFLGGKIKASNMGDMIKFGKVFDFKRAREAAKTSASATTVAAGGATSPGNSAGGGGGGIRERIGKAFERMKTAFTPDKASGWTANMQYTIEGADNYTVDIKDQKVNVQSGYHGTPTCKISVSAETMAGMIEGKISGQQAFLGGKIKASNMGDMIKFGKVFDFKGAREASFSGATAAASTNATATSSTENGVATIDLSLLFSTLPTVFIPENAAGWNGKIAFDIGGTEGWTIIIESGKVAIQNGKVAGAACTIAGQPTDFVNFLTGKTEWGNYKGKLTVNNQIALIKLAKIFNWKSATLADSVAKPAASMITSGGLNKAAIGRKYRAPAVLVKRQKIKEYAEATNDPNPRYKDNVPNKDFIAPPVFAVTLVGTLFREMLADDIGIDFARMVHGEQRIRILQHLVPGDIVSPRGTITNIETKATGGEVLTFDQFLYREGELAVQITTTLFVRSSNKVLTPKNIQEAASASAAKLQDSVAGKPVFTYQVKVKDDQPARYASASGDNNPIHIDPEIAKAAGFPDVILHGLCTMAFTGQAVVENKLGGDISRLTDISVRFSKPVFPKDTLTIEAFEKDDETLSFVAVNNQGVPVITNGVAHFH